jgi:cyclic beta-1,2-glucan synthetase
VRLARHRNLLELNTSAQVQAAARLSGLSFVEGMLPATLIVITVGATVFAVDPGRFWWALPFLALWLVAPLVAWRISTPYKREAAGTVEFADVVALRLIARHTWLYFATFVNKENHFLPPDNFQEEPEPVIAHRSSPTNFGLYLLSVVAARDFGWIGLHEMASRLEATLDGMDALPRHHGHFLNWIDTLTLRGLEPRYVSTVDSGNLAAMLLLVAQACNEALDRPLGPAPDSRGDRGPEVMRRSLALADESRGAAGVGFDRCTGITAVGGPARSQPQSLSDRAQRLESLEDAASDLLDIVKTLDSETSTGELREAMLSRGTALEHRGQRRDSSSLCPGCRRSARRAERTGYATGWSLRPVPRRQGVRGVEHSRRQSRTRRSLARSRRARQLFDEMDFRFCTTRRAISSRSAT